MIQRGASIGRAAWLVCSPLVAPLVMAACSSSEDGASPLERMDAGNGAETTADGSIPSEAGEDASVDAPEVETPTYDFAVKCASDPCVTRVAARGGAHACAVLQDGSVRCWGSNVSGQLGTGEADSGSMHEYEATPTRVSGISDAANITATGDGRSGTTCVLSGTGNVTCFGSNAWGQLGRGAAASSQPNPIPATLEGLQAKSVTLTSTFALAIATDDRLWSWGTNDTRQLARTTTGADAGSPSVPIRADSVSALVRASAGTSTTGFVVSQSGEILSWGGASEALGRSTSLARDPSPAALAMSDVSHVTAGAAHGCALRRGQVHCWGKNEDGQLGTGRKSHEPFPRPAVLPPGVLAVDVVAGGNNTCAIASNGDVYCWGANGSGQIGASPSVDEPTPRRIEGLSQQAVSVAVMDASICALLRNGSVVCWGDNLLGQLGRGSRDMDIHAQPGPVVFE